MKFKTPSQELIQKANEVLALQAQMEVLKPIIQEIKQDILDSFEYLDKYGVRVTNPQLDYLIAEQYCDQYYKTLDEKIHEKGFDVPEGHCPYLITENKYIAAVKAMNRMAALLVPKKHRIDPDTVYNLDHWKKLTQINLQYISKFI